MNILIPVGGKGERFKNNYISPKPFINIYGQMMIFWLIDNLFLQKHDTIYIGIMEDVCDNFGLEFKIKKEYPDLNIKIIKLLYQTRGAAETLLIMLQHIPNEELNKKILSLDCDTIYFDDIITKFRTQNDNVTFYFKANDRPEIFSYINTDLTGKLLDIQEKKWFNGVNKYANTGAYAFTNGDILKKYCIELLDSNQRVKNEFYVSQLIGNMIKDEHIFKGINTENFSCLGTPEQLNIFLKEIEDGKIKCNKMKRFCFDLDNTLVTYPEIINDYTTVKPKHDNINMLRTLKKLGHYIIIHTARRMRTHKGNVSSVEAEIKEITIQTLKEYDIPYDEIYFGKPYADVYIDDLGVNALVNTENNVGVYKEDKIKIIKPRDYNKILNHNNKIIKTSTSKDFDGEMNFYKTLPEQFKKYFPAIHQIGHNLIEMDRIEGVIFSELLASKSLTANQLLSLLDTINNIYSNINVKNNNIYLNYASKLQDRFEKYECDYNKLPNSDKHFEYLMDKIKNYEAENRGVYSSIIHGDPVFSNIILTENNNIKFFDPRGKLGNILTNEGDICYDFSKILQSLYGYDFIIMDKEIDEEYLKSLRNVFYGWVKDKYESIDINHVELICASLIFSLIPLHKTENHLKFFNLLDNFNLKKYF